LLCFRSFWSAEGYNSKSWDDPTLCADNNERLMSELNYGFKKTLSGSVDEIEARVTDALQSEGFGVLTRIDVASTFKKKLDVDFPEYRILGACNPSLAHAALEEARDIGLLLPCNVIVYESENAGQVVVSILDPAQQLAVSGLNDIADLAAEVQDRMKRVIEAI
jgi:uncharacterized protein (DUF302 family)